MSPGISFPQLVVNARQAIKIHRNFIFMLLGQVQRLLIKRSKKSGRSNSRPRLIRWGMLSAGQAATRVTCLQLKGSIPVMDILTITESRSATTKRTTPAGSMVMYLRSSAQIARMLPPEIPPVMQEFSITETDITFSI